MDIFGVSKEFQYVGWRNFVLHVIQKATYGFEIEKVTRQNIRFNKKGTACSFEVAKFIKRGARFCRTKTLLR